MVVLLPCNIGKQRSERPHCTSCILKAVYLYKCAADPSPGGVRRRSRSIRPQHVRISDISAPSRGGFEEA